MHACGVGSGAPLRIIFAKQHLADISGGAERALVDLANALAERGHQVKVICNERADDAPFYALNTGVTVGNLSHARKPQRDIGSSKPQKPVETRPAEKKKLRPLGNVISRLQLRMSALRHPVWSKRICALKRHLAAEPPDVLVAFTPEMAIEIGWAARALQIPCILALRISPEIELAAQPDEIRRQLKVAKLYDALTFYEGITVQLQEFEKYLPPRFQGICHCIANEIDAAKFAPVRSLPLLTREKNIICVSSFEKRKRVDWLIEAFAQLAASFPDWHLLIFGEGRQEYALKELVRAKECAGKVHFKGVIRQVEAAYAEGQIICLPSRYEGIPRAIAEGMASGLPAVGVNDCDGARFLLGKGNGCLSRAEDGPHGLAQVLAGLMASAKKRVSLSQQGFASLSVYKTEQIFTEWESYICRIASTGSKDAVRKRWLMKSGQVV